MFCPHIQLYTKPLLVNRNFTFKGQDPQSSADEVGYIAAGGTISTVEKDGEMVGSDTVLRKMFDELKEKTGKHYSIFSSPMDSSNYNRDLQHKLSGAVSNIVYTQIEALTGKKSSVFDKFNSYSPWSEYKKAIKPKGNIVTHGSDTLEENAALLAYEGLQVPVIYTASWVGPMEKGSDALSNIIKSQKLASDQKTPPGVFVVIGNEIHLATRIHKVNTKPWVSGNNNGSYEVKSYFASVDGAPVGRFDDKGNIIFDSAFLEKWKKIHADNPLKKYGINMKNGIKPAYVEHMVVNENSDIYVFKDLNARLSRAKTNGRKGALIEGNLPNNPEVAQIISNLNNNPNVLIVNSKDVKGIYPVQARIKLAVLLGIPEVPKADIPQLMNTTISGEIVDTKGIEDSHWDFSKSFNDRAEFIVAFPGMERNIIDDAVNRLLKKPSDKEKVLLINGFGDGHIPIGYMSIQDRLKEGFGKIGRAEFADKIIESINQESKRGEANFSVQNVIKHAKKILKAEGAKDPENQAKILLKAAFVETNELLKSIDSAIQKGISVQIGAKPDFAVPNLHAYEIGNILELIGVQGIDMPTHQYIATFQGLVFDHR